MRTVSGSLTVLALALASPGLLAVGPSLPDPIDASDWQFDDWDAGRSSSPFSASREARSASRGGTLVLMTDSDVRRIGDLLDLSGDQREILGSLAEEARARFTAQLVTLREREADLRMRRFIPSEQGSARAGLDAVQAERAELGELLLSEVYGDLRLLLDDGQLARWEAVEQDRERDRTLRASANFFAESLDPIEFARALSASLEVMARAEAEAAGSAEPVGPVALPAAASEVLEGYTRAIGPLLATRNAAGARVDSAAAELYQKSRELREEASSRADWEEMRRALLPLSEDVLEAAVRMHNTSLRIGALNLRAIDDLRDALPAEAGAELDRLLAEFTDEYGDEFGDAEPGQLRFLRRSSRPARLCERIEDLDVQARRDGGAGYVDPGVLDQLRDARDRVMAERGPLVDEIAEAYRAFGLERDEVELNTPGGRVQLQRAYASEAEAREARDRQLSLRRLESFEDELRDLVDIEQKWVEWMRELLTPAQRAQVADI